MIFVSNQFGRRSGAIGGGPGCLIFGILALVALWFVLKGLYALLYWAAPVLFVAALIVNWRAVAATGRDFLALMGRNPLGGLILGAFCVLAFPLLALYLLLRAVGHNKMEEMKQRFGQAAGQPEGEFAEYEELESQPKGGSRAVHEEPMEIPLVPDPEPVPPPAKVDPPAEALAKEGSKKPGNPYDQMFE